MNDGACDPQGRFWAGTVAYDETPGAASLYRLELDGSTTTMLTGLTISNGIGWSPDGGTMYLDDSGRETCSPSTSTDATGAISEPGRTLVGLETPGIVPDGLTVDEDGGIWAALWGGGDRPPLPAGRIAGRRGRDAGGAADLVRLRRSRPVDLFVTSARERTCRTRPSSASRSRVACSRSKGSASRGMPALPYRGRLPDPD